MEHIGFLPLLACALTAGAKTPLGFPGVIIATFFFFSTEAQGVSHGSIPGGVHMTSACIPLAKYYYNGHMTVKGNRTCNYCNEP